MIRVPVTGQLAVVVTPGSAEMEKSNSLRSSHFRVAGRTFRALGKRVDLVRKMPFALQLRIEGADDATARPSG